MDYLLEEELKKLRQDQERKPQRLELPLDLPPVFSTSYTITTGDEYDYENILSMLYDY